MEIKTHIQMNLRTGEVGNKVKSASESGLKDTVIAIARDVVNGSPVLTGNNRRSVQYDIRGLGADIFSSSGYGGYLEIGTSKMPARPYFKPAYDKNIGNLADNIKRHIP